MLTAIISFHCIIAAYFFGRWDTNKGWVLSASSDYPLNRTAHRCGGKFYYVIPESEFVHGWRPVPKLGPSK